MKFLVFNIVVLLSLGYLVTGQKNQSIGNWLDALPEKIHNSYETKDLANFLPGKEMVPALSSPQNENQVETLVSNKAEGKEDHKSKISAEKLEILIEETVRKSIAEQTKQFQGQQRLNANDGEDQIADVTKNAVLGKQTDELKPQTHPKSDEEFARAFAEFAKLDPAKKVVVGAFDETIDRNVANVSKGQEIFMSAYERRLALSDFIQQMQIVSVERGGF